MDKGVRNTLFGIAAFIAAILGLLFASYMVPRPMSDEDAARLGWIRFEAPRPISEFSMTDHTGASVGRESLQGQWSIVFFGFATCPDICPTTLSVLNESVAGLESHPQIIMVTVDPERDTPEKLRNYVPAFNKAFIGYTGTFDETVSLAQQMNVAFGKIPGREAGTYTMDHTASLVIVNPEASYAGFIKAPHSAQKIRAVIQALQT